MNGTGSALFERLPTPPTDIVGILVVVALANLAVFHSALGESAIRVVAGILFVLFVPGYALVAALFPEDGRPPTAENTTFGSESGIRSLWEGGPDTPRSIDRWERLALSFALSLAVVPLLAMAVTVSPLAFAVGPIFFTISGFTVLCGLIAIKRRAALPAEKRFGISVTDSLARTRRSLKGADSRGQLLLTIGLTAAILFAVGTFGFAILSPPDGETYTEFYVLSEDEDGELVAADYPDTFTPGEPQQLHVGVENYEGEPQDYVVVVQLQRIEETDEGSVVTARRDIDRYSVALEHEEAWVTERQLTVPSGWEGTDLRLKFLLYEGEVSGTPTSDTAYHDLHIWIDVESEDDSSTTGE